MLIMVKNGEVNHFTANMSLPHVEFVKRVTGELPEGAWVGTASKWMVRSWQLHRNISIASNLPGPPEVQEAVKRTFE
jgi:hypothetical protein